MHNLQKGTKISLIEPLSQFGRKHLKNIRRCQIFRLHPNAENAPHKRDPDSEAVTVVPITLCVYSSS